MDFHNFLKKKEKTYKNHVQQMKKNWNEYFLVLLKKTEIRDLTKPSSIQSQLWSFKYQHQSQFLKIRMNSYTLLGGSVGGGGGGSAKKWIDYMKHASQIPKQAFKNQTPNKDKKNTWHRFYRCWTWCYQSKHCFLYT